LNNMCVAAGFYDLRKISIIKNNIKKENNITMQSNNWFLSYKKVWYKNQINQSYD
jgi:hypothetical protein